MVTENNSQINTFLKGMNSDTSYSMLQEGLYVYANNIRIFQIDNQDQNGQGEIRAIEGIKEAIEALNEKIDKILASGSIRDLGVIIIKHIDKTWSVYTFKNTIGNSEHTDSKFGEITSFTEVFHSIEKTERDAFDIVCRYEDKDNIKLYIADGEHPIMLLNLYSKDESDRKYVTPTSINSISSHPTVNLFPAKVEKVIDGSLKSGMVSYAYRLYSKYGQASEISPATRMYPVVNKTSFGYEGVDYDKESNTGFRISIDTDSALKQFPQFDHIEIYRIHYSVTGQLPKIDVIGDMSISELQKHTLYYDDRGGISLKSITLEEFNTLSGSHIIPEVIESKNDYMFAAKIKADNSAYISDEIKNWDARSFSFLGDTCKLYNYNDTSDHVCILEKNDLITDAYLNKIPKNCDCFDIDNIMSNDDKANRTNAVYKGFGKNINWEFIYENIRLDNNYYGDSGKIIIQEGFSNPIISSERKSLRRGELYRYGIILYTNNGSKSDVKWIADIRTPESYNDYPFKSEESRNGRVLYGKSLGIKFTIENLPESVIGYEIVRCNRKEDDIKNLTQGVLSRPVKMFDNTTLIKQGGSVIQGIQSKIYPYMPTGYITTAWWSGGLNNLYSKSGAFEKRQYYDDKDPDSTFYRYYDNFDNFDIYQFISPESTYLKDSTINLLKNNTYLSAYRYLYPSTNKKGGRFKESILGPTDDDGYTYQTLFPIGRNLNLFSDFDQYKNLNDLIDIKFSKYLHVNYKNSRVYWNIYTKLLDMYDDIPGYIENELSDDVWYRVINEQDWYNILPIAYGYCKLYENSQSVYTFFDQDNEGVKLKEVKDLKDIKIDDIKIATEGSWNGIYESDKDGNFIHKYDNQNITIGNEIYCNYILGSLYGVDMNSDEFPPKKENSIITNNTIDDTLVASGGRCFVVKLSNNDIHKIMGVATNITDYSSIRINSGGEYEYELYINTKSIVGTCICNIHHNVTPYGGGSKSSVDTSSYYSYGDFFDSKNSEAKVFDGDCYPTLLEYVSAHKVYSGEGVRKLFCTTSIIYAIPVESNINTFLTNGFEFSRNADNEYSTNLLIEPSQVSSYLTQDKELYRYNSVYSSYSTHSPYVSESDEVKYNANNDCRVYFSEMKSNNENIDSWTTFKASNYIDVDSRYGAITALKDFKNILFFWQENATGRLASKERSVVSDINNIQLALGTGDILERYDYIDYIHGLHKDQFCLTQSNEALYWFDEHNQAIRSTTDGLSVQDLTVSAGVSNYMNKYELQNKNPKLFFDKKYNELISSVLKDKSIIYNQNLRAFTSFTDITFDDSVTFNNGTYLLKKDNDGKLHIAQWNCKQDEPTGWDGTLYMALTYVVNKQPIITKVFDNQEIVTINKPYSDTKIDKSIYENLNYSWYTDINKSESTLEGKITDREGNFRYAIPRANNADYGNRIRGKYMICEIEGESNYDTSISYILTKFRTSFS